jgi:hypothetical protein
MPVRDPAAGQVVRRNLDGHTVAFKNTNAKAPKLARYRCEHCSAVIKRYAE